MCYAGANPALHNGLAKDCREARLELLTDAWLLEAVFALPEAAELGRLFSALEFLLSLPWLERGKLKLLLLTSDKLEVTLTILTWLSGRLEQKAFSLSFSGERASSSELVVEEINEMDWTVSTEGSCDIFLLHCYVIWKAALEQAGRSRTRHVRNRC